VPVIYLSVSQAAQRKAITRSAVYQAIATGRLPSERIAGHTVLREKDVEAWTPLTRERRKGVRIGGRPSRPEETKRKPGRPKKDQEAPSA
jgi:excisionase family DNA binding protein